MSETKVFEQREPVSNRNLMQLYPNYEPELLALEALNGVPTPELLAKIIEKHTANVQYNKDLHYRYSSIEGYVPIMNRKPRFEDEPKPINNKIVNDFFGEIVDFKTGYFAGKPIAYGYNKGEEAEETTGGAEAVDEATKAVTDFVTRNNMFGIDMETTKNASISGYSGRLFYIDTDGYERVMVRPSYECIILSHTNISEPKYAIRFFSIIDVYGHEEWTAEFYNERDIYTFTGSPTAWTLKDTKPHLFDYCPLQGVANNAEFMGDAEKVLSAIDNYDKALSDNANEIEAFVHAYLIFEGLRIDDDTIAKGQNSGSFVFPPSGTQQGKAYWLTKNINDAFTEHHLKRLEDNIYRFSKTPNLNDEAFGAASGISLKFKLTGLETKCGMYQAQMMNAAQHMWKVLCSSWRKKGIAVDPLQITMEFKRNFPLDIVSEAQAAAQLKSLGLPMEVILGQLSFVDDPDYIMELIEKEKEAVPPSLLENLPEDENDDENDDQEQQEEQPEE